MESKFKPIYESEHGDAVISFSSSIFKVGEFITAVKQALQAYGLDQLRNTLNRRGGIPGDREQWYIQGVDCEFLKPGNKGWKKGKIRIKRDENRRLTLARRRLPIATFLLTSWNAHPN